MPKQFVEPIERYGLSKKSTKKTLFSKIGIIGCGQEGQNIARIAAISGMEVVFIEVNQLKVLKAIEHISRELNSRVENWGLTETEKKVILQRINGATTYDKLVGCDFVIEAVRANDRTGERPIELRKEIFRKIEKVVSTECIIATNATTVIITELASELEHKERCLSIHFMVNSPEARIVEVVKGLYTSDEVYNKVSQFVKMVRRHVIPVQESVGLVSIRLFLTMLNEACEVLMEGVASKEDINKLTNIGYGLRYGVFHMADIMGLEKIIRWGENLYEEFGDPKFKPSPVIKRLVRAKHGGVIDGQGFFKYDEDGRRIPEA